MNKIQNFVQIISLLAVSCCFFFGSCTEEEMSEKDKAPIEYVDPLLPIELIAWPEDIDEMGRTEADITIPGFGTPFAMTHWAFQNRVLMDSCDQDFVYSDTNILNLVPSHSIYQCHSEYASFRFMLESSDSWTDFTPKALSLKKEISLPHYFKGFLEEIKAEISISTHDRSALFEFTFHQQDTAILVLQPHQKSRHTEINFYPTSGEIWIKDSLPPSFPGLNSFFLVQTKNIYTDYGIWEGNFVQPKNSKLSGNNPASGFYLKLAVDSGEVISFKIGSSYWDHQDARYVLKQEIPDWDAS